MRDLIRTKLRQAVTVALVLYIGACCVAIQWAGSRPEEDENE